MPRVKLDQLVGQVDAIENAADMPLYVVTVGDDEGMSGCVAGFVTQSSIKPLRYLVCISEQNHTYGVAARSRGMAIHLLGRQQRDMASLFGEETTDQVDKFRSVGWAKGVTGAPILEQCVAWVEGPILAHFEAGDHDAFLIEAAVGGSGGCDGQLMQGDVSDFTAGHPA
ncbi:MAG TPA: flavin reductase family protein [Acidimicrobiales bacterium]